MSLRLGQFIEFRERLHAFVCNSVCHSVSQDTPNCPSVKGDRQLEIVMNKSWNNRVDCLIGA